MKSAFLFLTASALFVTGAQAEAPQAPAGFTALFNGANLDGWKGGDTFDPAKLAAMPEGKRQAKIDEWNKSMAENWRVENGELLNDGKGSYAATAKDYGDFELLLEYKTVPLADSGVYLRGAPQVQIWDSTEKSKFELGADKGSGGLWNNSPGAPGKDPSVKADKPFGEWNQLRIVMVGERVSVWLNGQQVVKDARMENYYNRAEPLPRTGPIMLQTHGGEIRWKNIFIREIPADEANKILSDADQEGFESIFNGRNLEGWAGATDSYQSKDGSIMCKDGQGGTLYWNKEVANFQVKLQFKLPPAGNNGLAIRYPGEGDTAYVGMTELQVLDNDAPNYTTLDPRQFHGSAYGMAPAKRGYLRPLGEWNFEAVTVTGSKITVELNGTRILDADLSKITEYAGGHEHPGKDRTKGFFGFAGHTDPVEFRDVFLKKLP